MDADTKNQSLNLQGIVIDFVLAGGVFAVFFLFIIPEHVPFYDPFWRMVFNIYTSAVMAGFFWVCFLLLRITITDQLRGKEWKAGWCATLANALRYRRD